MSPREGDKPFVTHTRRAKPFVRALGQGGVQRDPLCGIPAGRVFHLGGNPAALGSSCDRAHESSAAPGTALAPLAQLAAGFGTGVIPVGWTGHNPWLCCVTV